MIIQYEYVVNGRKIIYADYTEEENKLRDLYEREYAEMNKKTNKDAENKKR